MGYWIQPPVCCLLVHRNTALTLYCIPWAPQNLVITWSSQLYSSELWGALPFPSERQFSSTPNWTWLNMAKLHSWISGFCAFPMHINGGRASAGSQNPWDPKSFHSWTTTLYLITKKLSRQQMALFIWMFQLCILREYHSEKHKVSQIPRLGTQCNDEEEGLDASCGNIAGLHAKRF